MSKASKHFNSMDDVKTFVESMKGSLSLDDYELMLYYFGLLENRGVSDTVRLQDKEIKIDRYIAPMIIDLNQRGIRTLASCSGLHEEHPAGKFRPEKGYLSVAYDSDLLGYLYSSDTQIEVEESECYLEHAICLYVDADDDDKRKEKWNVVWQALKNWTPAIRKVIK